MRRDLGLTAQWLRLQAGDQYQVHRIGQIMGGSVDLLVKYLNGRRADSLLLRFPILGDIPGREGGGVPTRSLGIGGALSFLLVKPRALPSLREIGSRIAGPCPNPDPDPTGGPFPDTRLWT